MDKTDVYSFLEKLGIWYEITEHKAVYNMGEMAEVELPYPDSDAKNLFVRDDKKKNFYLITVKGDKRVDLKEFRRQSSTRALSFASKDDLESILKLIPGAVTPFGLLNDDEKKVKFYIDRGFLSGDGIIGVHPNDNNATVWLRAEDMIKIIEGHGNTVIIADF